MVVICKCTRCPGMKLVTDYLNRVQSCDIWQCEGPTDSLHQLNQDVHDNIVQLKTRIQELDRIAKEQDKESDKQTLLQDADNHRKQLTSMQASLRKANLTCQMAIEKREKCDLLEGSTDVRHRSQTGKEALAKSANSITENMMSITRLMATQVKSSEETVNTLAASSQQVGETQEEFRSMAGHIQSSKNLLTKYGRRECTDKLLILLALIFFFATVLYIVKKRFFS
ncbi:Vesicle transport protein SEC20 [Lamellibrachia satsuma]|nr:Vesicle transport protein SEC20 [Lamellibrachia satsuma]